MIDLTHDGYSPIEIYTFVKKRRLKKFPNKYWFGDIGKERFKNIFTYIVENTLKVDKEELPNIVSPKLLNCYYLSNILNSRFNGSVFEALDYCYPNTYKVWEFGNMPTDYWTDSTIKQAIYWLLNDKLKYSKIDILNNFSRSFLLSHGFKFIARDFSRSLFDIINLVYPNEFKEWELHRVSDGFWHDEDTVKTAIRWFVEEYMQLKGDDVYCSVPRSYFKESGLSSLFSKFSSYRDMIVYVYPNTYSYDKFYHTPNYKKFKEALYTKSVA